MRRSPRSARMMSLPIAILFCALLALSSGCSSTSENTSATLANQGILALSTNNPYLGTNLFLASQAEKSNILLRFLERRGGPTAMELIDESFERPRMILYYPKDKEVYAADLDRRAESWEWIVRGPFSVQREDYNTLLRMEHSIVGDPVFIVFGNERRFSQQLRAQEPQHRVLTPKIPLPVVTPAPVKPKVKKSPPVITTAPDLPEITDYSKLNTDQRALLIAKGYAERAENGDILHTVRSSSEKLSAVVKWYTGSTAAQKEIETMNNLTESSTLTVGAKVRIPLKLVKNPKAMP